MMQIANMHLRGGSPVVGTWDRQGQLALADRFHIEPKPMLFSQSGENPEQVVSLGSFIHDAPSEFRMVPAARGPLASNTSRGVTVEHRLAGGAPEVI